MQSTDASGVTEDQKKNRSKGKDEVPQTVIDLECPVFDSFRVASVGGIFDCPISERSKKQIVFDTPPAVDDADWKIGMIVGPSGSGKSTVAKKLYGQYFYSGGTWDKDKSVLDHFDEKHSTQTIVKMLSSVGFSSPPSWIKPFHVLSNGEQFRCELASGLLDGPDKCIVFDEFTSVVDRTVARVGSAAVAKAIRQSSFNKKFIAVACHYDIVDWLSPDWVLDMASGTLARRCQRRPQIELRIYKTGHDIWKLFKPHHYLSSNLPRGSTCYTAFFEDRPVGFAATRGMQGHIGRHCVCRIVVMPDYQGLGIGTRLLNVTAGLNIRRGVKCSFITSNPAMVHYCNQSPLWRCIRVNKHCGMSPTLRNAYCMRQDRLTVSFEYIGDENGNVVEQDNGNK